ncbi:MAG TPA: hypothetical protein VN784_12030 [Candidatus Limnocylindrales bacterium]|nr:hypothetical protein [Candidatus Limnocylindrales bacterium]
MKGLLTPAILAVAVLVFGVTVVLTCSQPPATADVLTGQSFLLPKSFLPMGLENLPTSLSPLQFDPDHLAFPPARQLNPSDTDTPSEPKLPLLAKRSEHQSLAPGVYQTYPWTIILVVPERGIDDWSILPRTGTNSLMPVIKPRVEVIPKA